MASQQSPSPKATPHRIEKSAPGKHSSPTSIRRNHKDLVQQHRPLHPKSASEEMLELDAPKTPERRQLAPRRAVSTPENVGEPGQSARSDNPMQKSASEQKLYTSPCGKKEYKREHYLVKHERDCDTCNRISMKWDNADVHGNKIASGRLSIAENIMEVCQETPDSEFHKHPGDSSPKMQSHEGDCRQNGNPEVSGSTDDSEDSPSPTIEAVNPPVAAEAGAGRAMTADGVMIDLEDEVYPEGKLQAKPFETRSNSLLIHDRLKKKLDRKLTPTDQRGYVYIFLDPERPHLLKIGRTKSIVHRMSQIHYTCGLELVLVKHFEVDNYIRTEGLIKTYILDLCRPYKCKICGRDHGEWFEIPKQSAETYMDRWATFMTQEHPYNGDSSELKPFFRNLFRLQEPFFRDLKYDELRERWTQILTPTATDRFSYRFCIVWEMFWRFYWPVNAMVAWTISFVAIQRPVIFALMSASVVGTFITVAHEYHQIRHDSMTKLKKGPK